MTTRERTNSRHRPSSIVVAAGAALTVSLAAWSGADVLDRRAAAAADPVVIVQSAARGTTGSAATSTSTRTRADGSVSSRSATVVVG